MQVAREPQSSYREMADVVQGLPFLLREARRARGLSLRAAAEQIGGTNAATLHRFESGGGLSWRTVPKVLRWLHGPLRE